MVVTVADLVEHAVDLVPDRVALVFEGRRLTYAQFEARANQLAHHLARHGVGPGDHVALYAANSIEAAETMLAVCKLRAVTINVNFRATENELRYLLRDSDAVALVHQRSLGGNVAAVRADCPDLKHVVAFGDGPDDPEGTAGYDDALAAESPERDFPERDPNDLFIIYTGGTTGQPKGVMWRHQDIWRVLGGGVDFMTGEPLQDEWEQARSGVGGAVVRLVTAPLIHGAAQWTLYGALFTAGTVVLMPRFDAHEVWRAITDERVNVIAIVGDAMARPLLEAWREGPPDGGKYDASSLLAVSSTAALMSPSVKREYLDTFPNVFLTEAVGSSETGFSGIGAISKDNIEPRGPRVNSSRETIVIDEYNKPITPGSGQVGRLARGGYLPQGYYKDPAKTATLFAEVDGKRYTVPGDFAIPEADGTFLLLGRGNTCINTGGEKVFPEEVEGALKSHPGVFDALVVGVPDERLGWRVGAIVQWREGHEPDAAALDGHGRVDLAGYKMPRSYWWVDQMPRLATGKADYPGARRHTENHPPSQELPVTAGH